MNIQQETIRKFDRLTTRQTDLSADRHTNKKTAKKTTTKILREDWQKVDRQTDGQPR